MRYWNISFVIVSLMDFSLGCSDVAPVFGDGSQGGLNAQGNVPDAQARRGLRAGGSLAGGIRDMEEASPDMGVAEGQVVEHAIHEVVAYEGACGIGHAGRDAGGPDLLRHGLDGQGRKVSRGAVGANRPVYGLVPFVVRDPGVVDIDGYPLRGQAMAPPCLPDTQDGVGLFFVDGSGGYPDGFTKHSGDFLFGYLDAAYGGRDPYDCFQGRIEGFAPKGVKRGEEDFHGKAPFWSFM